MLSKKQAPKGVPMPKNRGAVKGMSEPQKSGPKVALKAGSTKKLKGMR